MKFSLHWLLIAAVAITTLPSVSSAATIMDDFEDDSVGSLPGAPWMDITQRIDVPTVLSPTGTIVNTTGPMGTTTNAYQISNGIGTSSGILAAIAPATQHHLSADIRVDSLADPQSVSNFIADMSLLQDTGIADFNFGPQATVFVSMGTWNLYVQNAGGPGNVLFLELSTTPVVLGAWYHVELTVDATTGVFDVSIISDDAGFSLNRTESFSGWDPSLAQYDAIAFYDGEYALLTNSAGQFTVDNVSYGVPAVPAMSTWGVGILALLILVSTTLMLPRQ